MSSEARESEQASVKDGWSLLILPVLIVGVPWLNGYALSWLWRWFVMPALQVPAIGVGHAAGLYLTVAYLTKQVDQNEDKRTTTVKVFSLVLKPVFVLAVGWVIHQAVQ